MQEEATNQEPTEYGEVVGRGFVDKLLLAIIDAYEEPTNSPASAVKLRSNRLRDAKQALFGQAHPEGRPKVDDEAVLRWMGAQHYVDLGRRDTVKLRSDRELVREALDWFDLPGSSEERIRKKFSDQKQNWIDVAQLHDDVPEQLDHNLLQEIRGILDRRGVSMNLSRIER